jgi:TetR/AcrR family transcriptional regulator, transcriptional repressor for nem operon
MHRGRPLQYDPDQALDAAMHLFWLQGYKATTLQDLLKAMGLSKSSFYQGFGNKKALFLRCVNRYSDGISAMLLDSLARATSAREFIEEVLLDSASEARRDAYRCGCLLMNTATEFAQKDPEIAAHVSTGYDRLRHPLKFAIKRGQREGEISDLDAEVLANYLISSLAGLRIVVKGGAGEKEVREIVEVIMRALT